jgi:hypothetical protein
VPFGAYVRAAITPPSRPRALDERTILHSTVARITWEATIMGISSALRSFATTGVLAGSFFAVLSPSFAQTDPWLGTWRLNVVKSTFNPGPGPRALTVTYESAPGGYRVVVDATDAQGRQQHSEWPIVFDGRRHRVTGNPQTDEVASRRIDAYTGQDEYFKDGQPDGSATFVVSRDGKIITSTTRRLLANGREANNVSVLEKQ